MSSDLSVFPFGKDLSYPRFAAFYNGMMQKSIVRRQFDPLRQETAGRAQGRVLEVGAGGGQNFPFYKTSHVVHVEAVEPEERQEILKTRLAYLASCME